MIGGFFFNHVVLKSAYEDGRWAASTTVIDAGFCDDSAEAVSTEFDFRTRYYLNDIEGKPAVVRVVDVVLEDLKRLGVQQQTSLRLALIVKGSADQISVDDLTALRNMVDDRNYDLLFEAEDE